MSDQLERPRIHFREHWRGGKQPVVTKWIYVGTSGVDGATAPDGGTAWEANLDRNPHPYAPGDDPGPPPFTTGTNAFALDNDGNPRDGLRYCYGPHGVQLDCGGGISGLSLGDVICTLIGVPLPDTGKQFKDLTDGTDEFVAQLLPSGDLVYIGPVGIDGGGP